MKVALGMRPYAGPWGGGNRFIAALADGLAAAGHTVEYELRDPAIDVILLVDPRVRSPNVAFGAGAILRYLAFTNPGAVVIHRINECDERKGEPVINHRLVRANYCADWTVFVGSWLTGLPVWQRHLRTPWRVVLNGADRRLFNAEGFAPWRGEGPLRLVTHHWGNHRLKGFDVYEAIDARLDDPAFAARFAFTYVGRVPAGFQFRNARLVAPLDGPPLADELRRHHAYLTGSINEPGGNHQNEGALCGLPLVYRNSGCLPEYCTGFGVAYDGPGDVFGALDRLAASYDEFAARMPAYPRTAEQMVADWLAVLDEAFAARDDVIRQRRLWRDPLKFAINQLPI
jgi:hypothetical protein